MKNNKLKILVSAYACEPNLGSEIGVGWHWVLEMSHYFELWVLTRKSNQTAIEEWLSENPDQPKIHFVYYDLPKHLRFWKKGMRGVRLYYNIWQWCTNAIVKRTMRAHSIEIFHHLTYGNALWSVSKYGQQQFFVWGPIGGTETIPVEFTKHYHFKGRIIEYLRRTVVKGLQFNIGFNKRCKDANLILCKTESTFKNIPEKFKDKAQIFTDVAVNRKDTSLFFNRKENLDKTIQYFSVGSLVQWRGFDVLIEAFAIAVQKNPDIHLEILGKGPDRGRLNDLIQKLNMGSFISLSGQVSMQEYYQKMANCDVVVNPSLKEGAVTTAFDSMSFGKPLICVDTGGYTRYFKNEYAVIIPRTSRVEQISSLVDGIIQLTKRDERIQKGNKAKELSLQFEWSEKGQNIYKEIESSYNLFNK